MKEKRLSDLETKKEMTIERKSDVHEVNPIEVNTPSTLSLIHSLFAIFGHVTSFGYMVVWFSNT